MERDGKRDVPPAPAGLPAGEALWGEPQAERRATCRPARRAARWAFYSGLAVLTSWMLVLAGRGWERLDAAASSTAVHGVLPGEFERCQGLLLAPPQDEGPLSVIWDVITQVQGRVPVYLLARDPAHQRMLENKLRQANLADGDVHLLQVPFANPWVRDFGPLVIKSFEGGHEMLDFDYAQNQFIPLADRQLDDTVPSAVAASLRTRAVRVPLVLDGGNLLSNGAGLCVTTSELRTANPDQSWEETHQILRERLGAQQLVALDPLAHETTHHVDMFCTFTASDTIVVASCDARLDPENAAILDRNARLLAEVKTPCGPLKVERLPMPPVRKGLRCLSYTNVVYANGLLLVPGYGDAAPDIEEQVLGIYRRLLPGWEIRRINAEALLDRKGSLHCVSVNLYGM